MSKYLINTFEQHPYRNGKWIAPQNSEGIQNFYFRARTQFELSEVTKEAVLHVCAESYYLLYVNGIEVGRGPARGTHTRNYFDTYNVASMLRPGDNFIAVLCLCMNIDTFIAAPAEPGIIVELEEITSSNSSWEVQKAEDWRKDVCFYTSQTGFCEWRDFRKEPQGWLEFKDNSVWEKAIEIPSPGRIHEKRLLPRDIPALAEKEYYPVDIPVVALVPALKEFNDIRIAKIITEEVHSPVSDNLAQALPLLAKSGQKHINVEPLANNGGIAIIFDFDKEIIGRFELDITAPEGTIVDICHEEELWNNRLRADHVNEKYNFADRYILREGRQSVGNTLVERGFRLVQIVIRNFDQPVTIHNVRSIDARYPFVQNGYFFSSDVLLNKIWDVCCETLSACTTDVFIDCPWRERAFWVNDMIVENKTTLQAFGDPRINARAFRLAFSERDELGLLPGVCPAPKANSDRLRLLPVSLYMTRMLKEYCYYTGDLNLIKEVLPGVFRIIDVFTGWMNEGGLIKPPGEHWNFFDWSYGMNGIDYNGKITSLMNFFYISALKDCIELGNMADVDVEEEKYLGLINKAKGGVENFFLNGNRFADCTNDDGSPGISSQSAQALALLTGEFDNDLIIEALTDPALMIPEFYFHIFIFEAQRKAGLENEALKTIRKYWGANVMTGSPTIWEAGIHGNGKAAFGGTGSLCHGFATAPIDFIQTSILGVYPVKPGFEVFKVKPTPLDLKFAEGRIPTPKGNIKIRWERTGNLIKVNLRVPEGLVASTDAGMLRGGQHEFELVTEG